MSRQQVADSQRRRLLRAIIDEVAERGYGATTAASVYRRAGVSSRSFYEQFANKEQCFLAAYDEHVRGFIDVVRTMRPRAAAGSSTPSLRLKGLIGIYLDALAQDPNFARAALIEMYAAGPGALRQRQGVQDLFMSLFAEILRPSDDDDRFAIEALVGSITFLVTARVAAGELDTLPHLAEPIGKVMDRLFGGR
jgi:AcrR family transcriptional regulator